MRRYKRRSTSRPYRSRRTRTRRFTRRVRTTRIRRYRKYNVHQFKRHTEVFNLGGAVGYAPYLNAIQFKLSDINGYTEFTNMYDQYKINGISLKWKLMNSPEAQSASYTMSNYPELFYVFDYDDSASPTTLNTLREYANMKNKILRPNGYTTMFIRPRIRSLVDRGSGNIGFAMAPRNLYLDCSNSDIIHHGIKFGIDNFSNPNYVLTVEATWYLAFKNTH